MIFNRLRVIGAVFCCSLPTFFRVCFNRRLQALGYCSIPQSGIVVRRGLTSRRLPALRVSRLVRVVDRSECDKLRRNRNGRHLPAELVLKGRRALAGFSTDAAERRVRYRCNPLISLLIRVFFFANFNALQKTRVRPVLGLF